MEVPSLNNFSYVARIPQKTDLHRVIRENYRQVFYDREVQGVTFPFHLQREFNRYLTCGVMAHGFARFHCGQCNTDKLVAYSCKGRTICPSCTGRRMADTAKHLVEEVIPDVPVRQWVLSMPYQHRIILSSNKKLLTVTLGIYHRLINRFYTKIARAKGLNNPKVGSVTVIQRFGGALNLNVHFHTLFMDGVYHKNEKGTQIFKEIIPTDKDIFEIAKRAKIRINRAFKKRGLLEPTLPEENLVEDNDLESPELSLIKSESVQNKVDRYQKPKAIGKWGNAAFVEHTGKKYAYVDGFSLHANVKIMARRRSALERLCRYIARGSVAKERISLTSKGDVQLQLKRPYNDGTTHYQFTPEQFVKRLIALIPQPRQNFIRYYGVFGARHKNRKEITAKARPNPKKEKSKKKFYRTPWAELLKRVYKYEVLNCDNCPGKLELVATITSIEICKKILNHLKLDSATVSVTAPRAPPSQYEDHIQDDDLFNQESNW